MLRTIVTVLFLAAVGACSSDLGAEGGDNGDNGNNGDNGSNGDDTGNNGDNGDTGDTGGDTTPTAFRLRTVALRDPHVFADVFGCRDITDTPVAGISVNGELQKAIENDATNAAGDMTPDGLLDLSVLAVFRPLAQSAASSSLQIGVADCSAPLDGTSCSQGAGMMVQVSAENEASGACLEIANGQTSSYSPGVTVPSGPCFHGGPVSLTIEAAGITLALEDGAGAAKYEGSPATGLLDGVVKGFISESDADAAIIETPLGQKPLSEFLPGGTNNCSTGDDRDTGPGGAQGWYFYINFTAETVGWEEGA